MSTSLGSFPVRANAADVAAFRKATGLIGDGLGLPLTYPIRWLAASEIRAALLDLVPEPDLVLFHESQTFSYDRPLAAGQDYALTLTARRETSPDRLVVDGSIGDAAGQTYATVETVLRLFSTKAAAA